MLRSVRLLALSLALALLAPLPAHAQEPDGLAVTGWILGSGTNELVARNAGGLLSLIHI